MVKIPTKFEDLLPPAALGRILDVLNQPALSGAVREALNRVGIKDASPVEQVQEAWQQARDWVGQLANRMVNPAHGNPQLINATGELARAEWQGFPMAPSVAEAYGIQSVNFHHTARLEEACQQAASKLLHADDALMICSLASAIQLIQSSFANCAVSRADMVRVPSFGDVRAMLQNGSSVVLEVGATNGATESDWAKSIKQADQAILLVSPNSLAKTEAEQQRAAALRVAKSTGAAVIELLIDGVWSPNEAESAFQFPVIRSHLNDGTHAVIVPLDGFLGGPAGACIAGDAKWIKSLRTVANSAGCGLRGASLAATTAVLERTRLGNPLDTGVIDLIRTNLANLRERARRLVLQVVDTEHIAAAEIVERTVPLGASPWNRYSGPSVAVSLTPRKDVASLMAMLQSGEQGPSILSVAEGEKVLLDLRFLPPRDDHQVVKTLAVRSEQ